MRVKKHRLVIDTNLLISFLISKNFQKIDPLFFGGKCVLLFSPELLNEFIEVAQRPKFKRYFSLSDLKELLLQINRTGELITVTTIINTCRDEKDNFLLSLAMDGKASHILTGDKDLLVLNPLGEIQILTVARFLAEQ